jgi:hypothetical protein
MAKFGKKYRSLQKKEWEKEYINYKQLKHYIKEKKDYGTLEGEIEEVTNSFKIQLDKELKKFYLFFITQERELYLQINTLLHKRGSYSSLDVEGIVNEYINIFNVGILCSNIASYVNLNVQAIFKILKKFDHKLKYIKANLSSEYIIEKFAMKNSDLLYIFQYKMIDEVTAVIDDLRDELEFNYNLLTQNDTKKDEKLNEKKEPLILNSVEINEESIKKYNFDDKKNIFNFLLGKTENTFQETQIIFKIWNRIFELYEYRQESTLIKKTTFQFNKEIFKSIVSKINIVMSVSNERNIFISLMQTCFMNTCYSYFFPIVLTLVSQKYPTKANIEKNIYLLIIGMTPLGGLLSMIYLKYILYKTYKTPMLISCLLSIIGTLLTIFAPSNIFCLCLSRFLFGFGLNTTVNRKYLLDFIPKKKIGVYLIYFKILSTLGMSLGFFLTYICAFFYEEKEHDLTFYNYSLIPSLTLLFFAVLISLFVFCGYTEPRNNEFSVYAEGQAPTEAVSRGEIISIDDYMTNYESEKLNELNSKLSLFNDENNFNDTNLLSNSVEDIISREMQPQGTLSKAFIAIIFYAFIIRFQIFTFISITPIYSHFVFSENKKTILITAILFFITFFIFIWVFFVNLFYVSVKIERTNYILILGFIVAVSESLLSIFCTKNYFPIFSFLFITTINICLICEDEIFYFFSKTIPYNFEILNIRAITVVHIMGYLGEICGCFIGLISFIIGKHERLVVRYNIILVVILVCCLEVFFLLNSDKLKEKPIRRLMYKRNARKIQRMEF